MDKWTRFFYQPVLPLGKDGKRVTESEEHIALSRQAACEGMVLLKNTDKELPFVTGKKLALFGKGCVDYVKGGGGSAEVNCAYVRNLYEGLKIKEAEGKVRLLHSLGEFYEDNIKSQYSAGAVPGMTEEPELPLELVKEARAFTDTAVITISRFSGEGWDRTVENEEDFVSAAEWVNDYVKKGRKLFERGDYYLSVREQAMVDLVLQYFDKVILVLNVGGMVDTSWFKDNDKIKAVLMAWQAGMEGGLAAADILCGDVNPSGKLVDTFASRLEDYPSTAGFHKSDKYVEYNEDIYVGYRYFETVPGAARKVNYPFGFGLSYTEFQIDVKKTDVNEEWLSTQVAVTNVGDRAGKEVIQLYSSAPAGKLGKPAKELKAFTKTRLLLPGETQVITLRVGIDSLASYDDCGKVCKSAYVLEAGTYEFYVGNAVNNLIKLDKNLKIDADRIVVRLSEKCAPTLLRERMTADGSYEKLPSYTGVEKEIPSVIEEYVPVTKSDVDREPIIKDQKEIKPQLIDVARGKISLEEFMDQMTVEDMASLLGGQPLTGVGNTFGIGNLKKYGVPNVMTADGPAGLRIRKECGVNTTAWPCATLLACTFNTQLVEEVGRAGAAEVKENNIGIWLTPAMNIHRSPLCGRNFEYYSEDPYVAGKMAAAMIKGIQSQGIAATVKHFACNNKETNRKESDSRVSERALREIYLKGFEIAVKEARPWIVMSSYNIINGTRASENRELLTDILRGEWGFDGLVVTDWWNHGNHYKEVKAGNDVKMPCGNTDNLLEAYKEGKLSKEEIRLCAKRVLEMILKLS